MDTGRSQFTFYDSFYRALSRIKKKADRADAYDAIVAYALTGEEPDLDKLSDAAAIAFEVIRPNLDAARRKAQGGKNGKPTRKDTEKIDESSLKDSGKIDDTSCKQVKEQEQEKEKEQDKDKEQMLYTPTPPTGGPPAQEQQVDLSVLSPVMRAKLEQWLAYKKERRESYKPVGLQTLVNKIRTSAEKYGEFAVCELIDNSMSSGYQGILFDRLQQKSGRGRIEPTPTWAVGSLEQEAIKRMMATAGTDPDIAERAERLKQELNGM